ncbi:MAG: type II secretion system protein J [Chthoniobacteraceae bacterium]
MPSFRAGDSKPLGVDALRVRSAFTLLEVLISATILGILVVLISQTIGRVGEVWRQGQAQVEKSEGGRAILYFMAKELQAVILPVNREDQASLQLLVNPAVLSDFENHDAIFWQAPLASDQTLGNIAEMGYFVKWDNSDGLHPKALLCRFIVNPGNNYAADPNYLITSSPNAWLTPGIVSDVAPADSLHSYKGLFVENVLALWVTCLDPAGNAISQPPGGAGSFDSRTGYSYTAVGGSSVTLAGGALPAAIDISVVLIDSSSAKRITPAIRDEIKSLASDANVKNANDFVTAALRDNSLKSIRSGLRPCMTRIYLQNSK